MLEDECRDQGVSGASILFGHPLCAQFSLLQRMRLQQVCTDWFDALEQDEDVVGARRVLWEVLTGKRRPKAHWIPAHLNADLEFRDALSVALQHLARESDARSDGRRAYHHALEVSRQKRAAGLQAEDPAPPEDRREDINFRRWAAEHLKIFAESEFEEMRIELALNPYHRKIVHDEAEALGLQHYHDKGICRHKLSDGRGIMEVVNPDRVAEVEGIDRDCCLLDWKLSVPFEYDHHGDLQPCRPRRDEWAGSDKKCIRARIERDECRERCGYPPRDDRYY
eukprot:TRINITY_DN12755_c0_g1_i1.p1 TRINITY_DN12755_c0_g1~~TRINITY_DN12755_c0_g1_i1.p1  ORF type:complete len:281 (-),score=39.86 TRINITY_DN12755_c0_g1_i1:130-972(-)